jgi:hypothetical protein
MSEKQDKAERQEEREFPDVRVILRYAGLDPIIVGGRERAHHVKILLGFVGSPPLFSGEIVLEHRELQLTYPGDRKMQAAGAMAEALDQAGVVFFKAMETAHVNRN